MAIVKHEIMEFANKEMDNVVLSIDGRKEVHDRMRPFRKGAGRDVYKRQLLKTVARVLDEQKPEGSMVYRFGGDEFIVFIPGDRDVYKRQVYTVLLRGLSQSANY